jgi:glutamyl-tRNA reductase
MRLLCLGVSHHTAPVELRERLNKSSENPHCDFVVKGRKSSIFELAVLSTCNRLEVYASVPDYGIPGENHDQLFNPLYQYVAEMTGVSISEFGAHTYHYSDMDAVRHLCWVAAGLDSMVLGEPQILGQVSQAHEMALGLGNAGHVISSLFRTAIQAGKRVRTETAIGRRPTSLSSVAVHLAESVAGDLDQRLVLVIGAGKMGGLIVEILKSHCAADVTITSRTFEHAQKMADDLGCKALPFDQLQNMLAGSEVVFTAMTSPHFIIHYDMVDKAISGQTERSMLMVDLALPRNIDPEVKKIPQVNLLDLDDLQSCSEQSIDTRKDEIPRAEMIIHEEVNAFEKWLGIIPVIGELHKKAEDIRQREVERTLRQLPDLEPRVNEQIEILSRSIVTKLLHEPTMRLRKEANHVNLVGYTETLSLLFDLSDHTHKIPESKKPKCKP